MGIEVSAPTESEATARLTRWLQWQREHTRALEALQDAGAVLGGEQSGHVIYADHATTGDGTLTGIFLLDTMVRRGRTLSELASVMQAVPQVLRDLSGNSFSGIGCSCLQESHQSTSLRSPDRWHGPCVLPRQRRRHARLHRAFQRIP